LEVPSELDEGSLAPLLRGDPEGESLAIELEDTVLVAHRVSKSAEHATTWAVMQGR
jgi:hypothetical protein